MTFAKAFETALSMELANEKGLHEVRIPPEDSINKVNCFSSPKCPGKGSGDCFRCGQKHHPSECWCKTAQCYRCQEKGIIAKMCTQNRESHSTKYVENASPIDATEGTVDPLGKRECQVWISNSVIGG